jgi:hypothetical protein
LDEVAFKPALAHEGVDLLEANLSAAVALKFSTVPFDHMRAVARRLYPLSSFGELYEAIEVNLGRVC